MPMQQEHNAKECNPAFPFVPNSKHKTASYMSDQEETKSQCSAHSAKMPMQHAIKYKLAFPFVHMVT